MDHDITPDIFKAELYNGEPTDITVSINSPGGDCFAAAQIYNMLKEYPKKVTIKIDSMAASASSVIAMAGDKVLMSTVAIMMIHNPSTVAWGEVKDMQKAINMLAEVKESIINAYVSKTKLDRQQIANWMDAETWMNANKAKDLGFADDVIYNDAMPKNMVAVASMTFGKPIGKPAQARKTRLNLLKLQ